MAGGATARVVTWQRWWVALDFASILASDGGRHCSSCRCLVVMVGSATLFCSNGGRHYKKFFFKNSATLRVFNRLFCAREREKESKKEKEKEL
jgi:hypothetical protein